MKIKTYRIILILFFIITLKIILGDTVYGVESFAVYKDDIQLVAGSEIKLSLQDKQLELILKWTQKGLWNIAFNSVRASSNLGEDDILVEESFELLKGFDTEGIFDTDSTIEYKYTAKIKQKGETTLNFKVIDNWGGSAVIDFKIKIIDDSDSVKIGDITAPGADASYKEIKEFFIQLIDNLGEGKKLINELLNIKDFSIYQNWKKTVNSALEVFKNNNNNTNLTDRDKELLNAEINLAEKILKFIDQAVGERANGNTSDKATGNTFIKGDEEALEEAVDRYIEVLKKIDATAREYNEKFDDVLKNIAFYNPDTQDAPQEVVTKVNKILTVITNLGIIMSVIMPAILGIKYMMASVEERADFKKGMIPYVVGSILLFGICAIVRILQMMGESINKI